MSTDRQMRIAQRDWAIISDFALGDGLHELAERHGLSVMNVRHVIGWHHADPDRLPAILSGRAPWTARPQGKPPETATMKACMGWVRDVAAKAQARATNKARWAESNPARVAALKAAADRRRADVLATIRAEKERQQAGVVGDCGSEPGSTPPTASDNSALAA